MATDRPIPEAGRGVLSPIETQTECFAPQHTPNRAVPAETPAGHLLIGERAHFLAINSERANELMLLEHWHNEKGPGAGVIDELGKPRIAFDIALFRPDVGNMNDLRNSAQAGERNIRMKVANDHRPASRLGISRRCAMQREGGKRLPIIQE